MCKHCGKCLLYSSFLSLKGNEVLIAYSPDLSSSVAIQVYPLFWYIKNHCDRPTYFFLSKTKAFYHYLNHSLLLPLNLLLLSPPFPFKGMKCCNCIPSTIVLYSLFNQFITSVTFLCNLTSLVF